MITKQIEEVLPGIYKIPVPLTGNPLKELNSYLIQGNPKGAGTRHLLVDTGFRTPECRNALLEGLSVLNVSMEDTDILLTHLHADHSGNAPELICPGGRVYMSEPDRNYVAGKREESGTAWMHRTHAERFFRNGISQPMIDTMLKYTPSNNVAPNMEFKDYTTFTEGTEFLAGDYRLRAIHTPGHTPGQMCFEIVGTKAMILGDHVLFDITPNITDWDGVEDSLGDYLASLDKIDKYDVTIPLPGHRKPGDFHGRIQKLKKHHELRLEECEEVIHSLGKARLYDIAGNMKWKIRTAGGWDTFPPGQRWFALGECLSHIDHLKKTGRIIEHKEEEIIWYEA